MKKIISILLILFICGCSYDPYKMPKDAYIKTNDKTYEIYSQNIQLKDLIEDTNTKIINKKDILKTTKIGKNKVTIIYTYKNKKREYKYDVNYNVVDTTKPKFLNASSTLTIYKDEDVDFCDKISYIDNYDSKVKCYIEGDINYNVVGTYNLKYVLEDSSNNVSDKDFTVNIIEKIENNSSNENINNDNIEYLNFSDVVKNYKNKKTMIGIDVSKWQKDIDFKKVKDAGCEFVIIRMGVNTDIDKDISEDTYYRNNIKNAKKAGLKVGVYIYTTATTKEKALEHANWTNKILNTKKLDFPVVFDWENWDSISKYNVSMYDITNVYLTFDKQMKKYGYDTMLYSSMNYLNNVWMFNDTYNVWLAHYTDKTSYEGKYIMWQMASNGKIDGIDTPVDIDIYYKE
ncbi:MAG: glycoside hydrolase family 25 [Bacilli bacterium]|nr:glycoside hydrolase family 25 [Bacilli bacterium]